MCAVVASKSPCSKAIYVHLHTGSLVDERYDILRRKRVGTKMLEKSIYAAYS